MTTLNKTLVLYFLISPLQLFSMDANQQHAFKMLNLAHKGVERRIDLWKHVNSILAQKTEAEVRDLITPLVESLKIKMSKLDQQSARLEDLAAIGLEIEHDYMTLFLSQSQLLNFFPDEEGEMNALITAFQNINVGTLEETEAFSSSYKAFIAKGQDLSRIKQMRPHAQLFDSVFRPLMPGVITLLTSCDERIRTTIADGIKLPE